jgi:toxin ParE1/3/4
MSFGYFVRPKADRDLDEIADYLADVAGLDIALRFLAEAQETFTTLAGCPEMGWPCRMEHPELRQARKFRVSSSFDRYMVFYRPCEAGIEVLRVLHGSQDVEARLSREGIV